MPERLEESLLSNELPPLFFNSINPLAKDAYGQDLLSQAATRGLPLLTAAALPTADPSSRDFHGMSALHLAAAKGNAPCVLALLDRFDPAEPAFTGRCPLMHAAKAGSADCVRILLAAGADPARRDALGWSALMWAAQALSPECVDLLLPGSDPQARNDNGMSADEIAATPRKPEPSPEQLARAEAIQISLSTRQIEPGSFPAARPSL